VCEQQVSSVHSLIERGKKAYEKTSRSHRNNAIFLVASGVVFQAFGILTEIAPLRIFMLTLGAIFVVASLFAYRSAQEFRH
jgi:hypothetical protein